MKIGTRLSPVEQVLDEREQTLVGPLQILEDQHHGSLLGEPREEHAPAREQLRPRHRTLRQAQQHAEAGRQELAVARIRRPSLQALAKPLCDRGGGCVLGDPEPLANDVRERRVGDPLAVGEAAAVVPQDGLGEPVRRTCRTPTAGATCPPPPRR